MTLSTYAIPRGKVGFWAFWDWLKGVFGKEPPVVGELDPLLSPKGAEAERSMVDILKAKKATECLNDTGNTDEYYRIKGLSTKDFLKEFAPGWNGKK